jgi:hypothetical protein
MTRKNHADYQIRSTKQKKKKVPTQEKEKTNLKIVVGEIQGGDMAKGHADVWDNVHGQATHVKLLVLELLLIMLSMLSSSSSCCCSKPNSLEMAMP